MEEHLGHAELCGVTDRQEKRIAQLEAELGQAKADLAYQTEARCRDAEDAYGKLRKVGAENAKLRLDMEHFEKCQAENADLRKQLNERLDLYQQLRVQADELRRQTTRDKQAIGILSDAVEGYQSGHVRVEIQKELDGLRKDRDRLIAALRSIAANTEDDNARDVCLRALAIDNPQP